MDRERGAIAVMLTLLISVVILTTAAFSFDLANAFAVKRQLSVAADAASLAAAAELNNQLPPGATCDEGDLEDPTSQAGSAIWQAATDVNQAGDLRAEAVVESIDVTCNLPTDVQVRVVNRNPGLPTFFGSVNYAPANASTARIFVPDTVSGLRPYAACIEEVQSSGITNQVIGDERPFVVLLSKGQANSEPAVCGTATRGNWGILNFEDQGTLGGAVNDPTCPNGGSEQCQLEWTVNGYNGALTVPNMVTDLSSRTQGVEGNTGFPTSAWQAMRPLVEQGETILLPAAAVYTDSGGQGRTDVSGVVAVTLCGARSGSRYWEDASDPACGSTRPVTGDLGFDLWESADRNNRAAVWAMPTQFIVSSIGGNQGTLGDVNSDFGVRAVQLWK